MNIYIYVCIQNKHACIDTLYVQMCMYVYRDIKPCPHMSPFVYDVTSIMCCKTEKWYKIKNDNAYVCIFRERSQKSIRVIIKTSKEEYTLIYDDIYIYIQS